VDLKQLKQDIDYKWKPQECKEYGATMVAYIDSRDVQDLLDKVCGQEGWQDRYREVKGHVYCEIGIKCGEEWVWKGDCGSPSNFEEVKGESSDAFKRAAVKWGIGRFLYSLGILKLKAGKHTNNKFYPADDNGRIIWDKQKLNDFCNKRIKKPAAKPEPVEPSELSDRQIISAKFAKLPKMDDLQKAIMSNVVMINKTHKPKGVNDGQFKEEVAVVIYDKYKRWPENDDEEDLMIQFIDKHFKEKNADV
jgi:hypothetical protein